MEEKLCEKCPLYGIEDKCKLSRNTLDCKIARALRNCGYSKGLVCLEDERHEIGCETEYDDYYSVILILTSMLKRRKVTLSFAIDKQDEDMKYLLNLLEDMELEN